MRQLKCIAKLLSLAFIVILNFFPSHLFFFSHSAEYCISNTPICTVHCILYSITYNIWIPKTPNREYCYAYEFLVLITWLAIERKSHRLNKVKFKCRGWYFFFGFSAAFGLFCLANEMNQLPFQWGRKYKSTTKYCFFKCDQWQYHWNKHRHANSYGWHENKSFELFRIDFNDLFVSGFWHIQQIVFVIMIKWPIQKPWKICFYFGN